VIGGSDEQDAADYPFGGGGADGGQPVPTRDGFGWGGGLDAVFTSAPTPSPEPSPTPTDVYRVPEPAGDTYALLAPIVCRAVFVWDCDDALAVGWCEMGSRWNPQALGRAGERGVFQLHPIHAWRWADYWEGSMIPSRNAEMAHDLFLEFGWSPTWSCATLLGIR